MDIQNIVDKIYKVTNGTFIGSYCTTTLMGWFPKFDDEGRPLNCDPNYKDSIVTIDGVDYSITRKGWHVWIWNPEYKCNYCTAMALRNHPENKEKIVLKEIDLTPDYVREYYNKIK